MFECKKVTKRDFKAWLGMGVRLWPEHTQRELGKHFREILKSRKELGFICRDAEGSPVGFANVSIRRDYVEGSESSPVGYLEGIFVEKKYRKHGVAKLLLKQAEKWAKARGCREFGSDAELWNTKSQKFHKAVGFKEANRIVAYIKKIT